MKIRHESNAIAPMKSGQAMRSDPRRQACFVIEVPDGDNSKLENFLMIPEGKFRARSRPWIGTGVWRKPRQ